MQDRLSGTGFLSAHDDCAVARCWLTTGSASISKLMAFAFLSFIALGPVLTPASASEASETHVPAAISGTTDSRADATDETTTERPVSDEVRWKRAIDRDDGQALRQLLNQVDVKLSNDKGKTALMAAAKTGDLNLLELLLQKGLALDDRSFTGGTSLMYAALGKQTAMISYLLDARRDADNFQAFVDAESTNGWTAVMIAAAKGFDDVVRQLVEEGQADAWRADAYQWSPLMRAIDNRHSSVVRYLLEREYPELNSVNENGATALHVAVEKGDVSTVRLLLDSGVDQETRDNTGRTAVDIARSRNDKPIMQLLAR